MHPESVFDCEHVLLMFGVDSGALYKHTEFIDACHDAILERFTALTPSGSSVRAVALAMQRLKTPEEHQAVLNSALILLRRRGTPVDSEGLREGHDKVVACFPVSP